MIETAEVKIELDDPDDYSSAIENSLMKEDGWNLNHPGKQ